MTTPISKPVFSTERLNVYRLDYVPDPDAVGDIGAEPHACFVGIDRTSGNFGQAVTATVRLRDGWIEWLETSANCRRRGLAKELLIGIEDYLGRELVVQGCTTDGQRFEAAWDRSMVGRLRTTAGDD